MSENGTGTTQGYEVAPQITLAPDYVTGQAEEIKKASTNLMSLGFNDGKLDYYRPLEEAGLLEANISTTILAAFTKVTDDMTKLNDNLKKYVENMGIIDGQIAAPNIDPPWKVPPSTIPEVNPDETLRKLVEPYAHLLVNGMGGLIILLEEFAQAEGITLATLITEARYREILDNYIKNYRDTAAYIEQIISEFPDRTAGEYQMWLRSIMHGENIVDIPNTVVNTIKNRLTSIANKKGISTDQLLEEEQYSKELEQEVKGYAKVRGFFDAMSKDNANQKYINAVYNGKVPSAYGLKNEDVQSFKDAVDKYAADNKISTTDIFTKPEYADKIKESLNTFDKTGTISEIYKDASKEQVQTVVKNVYNSKIENKTGGLDG